MQVVVRITHNVWEADLPSGNLPPPTGTIVMGTVVEVIDIEKNKFGEYFVVMLEGKKVLVWPPHCAKVSDMKTITKRVFVQKHDAILEFCAYSRDLDRADFKTDLGSIHVRNAMQRDDLIRQLRDTLEKLEAAGDVDVFVVQ